MRTVIRFEYEGLDKAVKGILGGVNAIKGVQEAVKKNGAALQAKAQDYAPVDTGFLKRSITLKILDGELTADITSGAYYAGFQEYGTRYQPGTAHMIPAAKDVEPQFQKDCEEAVKGSFK